MNRFSARSVLSSLIVTSLLAFSGVAHAEGGAGGEAGDAGAPAGGAAGAGAGAAGDAGAPAGGAAGNGASGEGGAPAGGAGGGAGAPATSCVGFKAEDAKPLTTCDAADKPVTTEFFCKDTSCSKNGKSCKAAYEACIADPLCSAAVYCGSLCAPGEDAVTNCGSVAGASIGKALAVSACADELSNQAMGTPASACTGTAGAAGAGGSGAAGEPAGGSAGAEAAGAAGESGEAGAAGSATTSPPAPEEDDGCGCSVPGASRSSKAAGLVALGMLAFGLRRRRNAK
jgi:MYXO-CTERM domain-containing protein